MSKKRSQTQIILDYLSEGNTLSPMEARQFWGVERLAARIADLRSKGYTIWKVDRADPTGKTFAEYYIPWHRNPGRKTGFQGEAPAFLHTGRAAATTS